MVQQSWLTFFNYLLISLFSLACGQGSNIWYILEEIWFKPWNNYQEQHKHSSHARSSLSARGCCCFSSRRCLIISVRHSSSYASRKYGSVSISDRWTSCMSDLSHSSMSILRLLTVVDLASCSISDKIDVKICFLDFFSSFNHIYEPSSKSLS